MGVTFVYICHRIYVTRKFVEVAELPLATAVFLSSQFVRMASIELFKLSHYQYPHDVLLPIPP